METSKPTTLGKLGRSRAHMLCLVALASLIFGAQAQAEFAGGLGHTCWVSGAGSVECWGLNDAGQLGDGTLEDRAYPFPVAGLGTDAIVDVDTGEAFSCALTSAKNLLCWGDNSQGQLGDGTRISSLLPITVAGIDGLVQSFALGRQHVCAVLTGGTPVCWGDNSTGQLGDGNFFDRLVPTPTFGLAGLVASVASGYDHSCAVTLSGDAFCWGSNSSGQLGDGTLTQRLSPSPVVGLTNLGPRVAFADRIAAGLDHTCALSTTGTVLCWGGNTSGQVGDSVLTAVHTSPLSVGGITGAVQDLQAGASFNCVLLDPGGIQCWGENIDGQLGDGSTVSRFSPAFVTNMATGVLNLGLGDYHACSETSAGLRFCWGDCFYGQLGNGSNTSAVIPIEVLGPEPLPLSFATQLLLGLALALSGGLIAHRHAKENAGALADSLH